MIIKTDHNPPDPDEYAKLDRLGLRLILERIAVHAGERQGEAVREAIREARRMRRPVRKHISDRQCGGKETACLPGKSGACVACCDDE